MSKLLQLFLFVLLIFTVFSCSKNKSSVNIVKPKTNLNSINIEANVWEKKDIIKLFTDKSLRQTLPKQFNYDSLLNLLYTETNQISILPFISEEFIGEFEPVKFTPFCFEDDSINKVYYFYIYFESMPGTNAYRAIHLFTTNYNLNLIDCYRIADNWLFSGSAGESTIYKKTGKSKFKIVSDSYDIDYHEEDNAINYLMKITSVIEINKLGKTQLIKSDTLSWEEKVKFD